MLQISTITANCFCFFNEKNSTSAIDGVQFSPKNEWLTPSERLLKGWSCQGTEDTDTGKDFSVGFLVSWTHSCHLAYPQSQESCFHSFTLAWFLRMFYLCLISKSSEPCANMLTFKDNSITAGQSATTKSSECSCCNASWDRGKAIIFL